jgi:hypothetical protein
MVWIKSVGVIVAMFGLFVATFMPSYVSYTNPKMTQTEVFYETWDHFAIGIGVLCLGLGILKLEEYVSKGRDEK